MEETGLVEFFTGFVLFLLIAPLALIALVLLLVYFIVYIPHRVYCDFSNLRRSYEGYLEKCNKLEERIAKLDHGFVWKTRMPETLKFWNYGKQYENIMKEWQYLGHKLAELDPKFAEGWKLFNALSLIHDYLQEKGNSLNSFREEMYATGTMYARI